MQAPLPLGVGSSYTLSYCKPSLEGTCCWAAQDVYIVHGLLIGHFSFD